MLYQIIKYYSIFFCCMYIYFKISNQSSFSRHEKTFLIILLPIITIFTYMTNLYLAEFTYILPLILLWIILSIYQTHPQQCFVAAIISFVISFIFHAIPSFILTIIFIPILNNFQNYPYFFLAILSSLMQFLLCKNLFKIKRFKKGMPFLLSTNTLNIATITCILFITCIVWTTLNIFHKKLQLTLLLCAPLALAFIIFWWQAQLIKDYKRRMMIRELESLRLLLEEKEEEIAILSKKNEDLGRLIHKDNKLIPSMINSVKIFLSSDFSDTENVMKLGNDLLEELEKVSNNRANVITKIHAPNHKPYDTGIMAVDTMLNYMRTKLKDKHINFTVNFGVDLKQYVPSSINDMDLGHLLSDLIDNAYNATLGCENATILVQFYEAENALILEIADNGIPFDVDVLLNYGLEAKTTHPNAGGHGFGLLDIWQHKTNYRATLHIDEYEEDAPFSKKISLIFNKKNKYTIRTWRKDDLEKSSQRTDLQIYDTTV